MLIVVQIQKLSKEPRTTASCCTWFRSMVVSSSFKKVLLSCANSTVQRAVTQSGRGGAIAAATAEGRLQPETSLWVTFQDRRQPGHQDAAPVSSSIAHHPTPELRHWGHRCHRSRQAARRSSQSLSNGHPTLHSLSLRHSVPELTCGAETGIVHDS